ncbi:MAG: hypothetical protein RMY34_03035 [Aulosira sp. DedQUE10]|nr:hypothetical protein [Aulosira sp. DedQUE10]
MTHLELLMVRRLATTQRSTLRERLLCEKGCAQSRTGEAPASLTPELHASDAPTSLPLR